MPHNVQAWVREKKPKKMSEAGRLANDYMRSRKLNTEVEIIKSGELMMMPEHFVGQLNST